MKEALEKGQCIEHDGKKYVVWETCQSKVEDSFGYERSFLYEDIYIQYINHQGEYYEVNDIAKVSSVKFHKDYSTEIELDDYFWIGGLKVDCLIFGLDRFYKIIEILE